MKVSEICKELDITRQGLYYLLENSDLKGHAVKDSQTRRWTVDDEGFEILKELRRKNKKVMVDRIGDKEIANEIHELQLHIRQLQMENRMLTKKLEHAQTEIGMVEDIAQAVGQSTPETTKRDLLGCVKSFRNKTTDRAIRKEIKTEDDRAAKAARKGKADPARLEALGQETLF